MSDSTSRTKGDEAPAIAAARAANASLLGKKWVSKAYDRESYAADTSRGYSTAMGRGFEVEDSTGRLRITDVQIRGASVAITLAAAPRGAGLSVRYAMTQDVAGYAGGPGTGRRGQLRDSDPYVGSDRAVIRARVTRGSRCSISPAGSYARLIAARMRRANTRPRGISRTSTALR